MRLPRPNPASVGTFTVATAAATASAATTSKFLSICLIALAAISVLCFTLLQAIATVVPQQSRHRLALLTEVLKYRQPARPPTETDTESAP